MSTPTTKTCQTAPGINLENHAIMVCFSDAEAQVIGKKAQKANLSLSEYIRNAALGFPMP